MGVSYSNRSTIRKSWHVVIEGFVEMLRYGSRSGDDGTVPQVPN